MKIVQALILKRITKTEENETKKQKAEFLGMLLGTLEVSLLGNIFRGKRIVRTGYGNKNL